MDESAPIRAIVIGVSTLLAIATISAVLMYYNTAKQMASNVGRGQDFAGNYEQSIQDILTKGTYTVSGSNYITGADVKNLLNYFYNNEDVWISFAGAKVIGGYDDDSYTPIISTFPKIYNKANLDNYEQAMNEILDNRRFIITDYDENADLSGKPGTYIRIATID